MLHLLKFKLNANLLFAEECRHKDRRISMAHGENNYSYNPHARGCDKKNLALKMFSSRILMGTKGGLKNLSIVFLFAYIGEALFVCPILCIFLYEAVYFCVWVCICESSSCFPFIFTIVIITLFPPLLNYFSFYFNSFLNYVLST